LVIVEELIVRTIRLLEVLLERRVQLKLKNRSSAGKILGELLKKEIDLAITLCESNGVKKEIIVLGVPRGGVITARAVATKLSAKFLPINSIRLLAQYNKELTIGAVVEGGEVYINQEIVEALNVSQEYLETEKRSKTKELNLAKYRFSIPGSFRRNITDNIVVLIDDGAATGATLIAATRYVRKFDPAHILVGIPVAPRAAINSIKVEAENVVSVLTPEDRSFSSVEQYYVDFRTVSDKEVENAMNEGSSYCSS
jgi:predicted phosphoribosyltransferase